MTSQIGDYVRASYDFPGEAASDLPFSIGDVIKIIDVVDENWATGQKLGAQSRTGIFPLAFVEHVTLPSVRTGQKVFLAIENFPAEQNGDLELSKGDIIIGVEPVSESWWRGKNGPLKGIFPLSMVEQLELNDGLRSRSASACSGSLRLRSDSVTSQSESSSTGGSSGFTKVTETTFARALVDVTPQLDGELGFQLGDLIEITEILDDDWFYGKCRNKEGLVSAVCVELLIEDGEVNDYSDIKFHQSRPDSSSNQDASLQEPNKLTASHSVEVVNSRTGCASNGSYTSENTRSHDAEITAYGRVIYPFTAQIPTELSLTENSLVTLIQHVDSDWTEGEINGKRGLFPTSFIEIIVNCPYAFSQGKQTFVENSPGADSAQDITIDVISNVNTAATTASFSVHESSSKPCVVSEISTTFAAYTENGRTESIDPPEENHEIGLILYNFVAEVAGDVSVKEGDTVEVIKPLNENWLKIQTENGQVGQVPRNHVEIIGAWPKLQSKSPEPVSSVSSSNAFIEDNVTVKSAVTVPETFGSSFSRTSEDKNYAIASAINHKPILSAKSKPQLLPKPVLTPKPTLASKPTSVMSLRSVKISRQDFSSAPKTSFSMLENRTNSLSALDEFIKEEISKAKGNGTSQNSDCSSSFSSDVSPRKESDKRLPKASPVFFRETCISDESSESSNVLSTHNISAFVSSSSVTKTSATVSFASPLTVNSERQDSSDRRSVFSSSLSFTGERADSSDAVSRRKSASFVEQKTHDSFKLPADSTFVNKAFQMDTAEGILIDLNEKIIPHRRAPVRVTPPRPVSAIVSSTSFTSQTSPSKIKHPPPRPTGPRVASAPSRTPLMPSRVEPPSTKLVPKRPAPKAPGGHSQNINIAGHSGPHSAQPVQRTPSRPGSLRVVPKRPPPRPADLMSFSPDGSGSGSVLAEEPSKELVADLKSKLEENQADIKKFEQTQSDLQKSLAQASSQEKKAEAKDNLEFVERQLCGLREEESRLKENLFAVSPHEARLEKARLLAAQHAEEELKRKEEEKKKEAEMMEKRKDQREKVIGEILDTEKDFLFSLQLCLETFLDGQKPPAGVDLSFLLGNMEEIADVSQKMVNNLETCISGNNFDEQYIGKCFTFFAEDMKNTYAPYCRNHDDVITAMERYTENTEINDYLNAKIEKMREQMNVFDVAGVLIKPVQRILKYPLLLNELLKNTEEGHPYKEDIVSAITAMTDVAKAINEYKRRKDLVYKYKKFTDQTFSDKISKLNLHSIRKKSSRIKGRLSTNFGIALQMRDETFEKEEAKFRHLERAVKVFLRGVIQFLDQSQETMQLQEIVVDGIKDFYKGKECQEVTKLHEITGKLLELFDSMKETVENIVVVSLNTLVALFTAPAKVIEKRFDKLLDYNYQLGKAENVKELQAAKIDYEAMNAQLLDELPKFYTLAFKTLKHCIAVYVLARRDFMDQSLKESCALLSLPSMANRAALMETFQTRHMTVFDHLSLLSFIPKGFNPKVDTIKADRAKLKGRAASESGLQQQTSCSSSQTEKQKQYLHQLYPDSKLYTVTSTHNAVELMDISLSEGTLVGVIKELDPMGSKERWFVDDGANKGFAPCNILAPLGTLLLDNVSRSGQEEDLISILSCDSGDVIISGNDDRVEYHVGGFLEESSLKSLQEQTNQQYYYALYDFTSRHPNEASLLAGHPVTVLSFRDVDGNSEWWLVESEGTRGYAPANYMAPMPYS